MSQFMSHIHTGFMFYGDITFNRSNGFIGLLYKLYFYPLTVNLPTQKTYCIFFFILYDL